MFQPKNNHFPNPIAHFNGNMQTYSNKCKTQRKKMLQLHQIDSTKKVEPNSYFSSYLHPKITLVKVIVLKLIN